MRDRNGERERANMHVDGEVKKQEDRKQQKTQSLTKGKKTMESSKLCTSKAVSATQASELYVIVELGREEGKADDSNR